MGIGYRFTCSVCGLQYHISFGLGFLFPQVYRDTVTEILEGLYGDTWKNTWIKYEGNIAVNAENYLFQCDQCGNWHQKKDMSLYRKKIKLKPVDKSEWFYRRKESEKDFVTERDLKKDYYLIERYVHKCEKCGEEMTRIDAKTYDGIEMSCPMCGKKNPVEMPYMWD